MSGGILRMPDRQKIVGTIVGSALVLAALIFFVQDVRQKSIIVSGIVSGSARSTWRSVSCEGNAA